MNKGDSVYIFEDNKFLIATVIKRIESYHGISYNMVNGDGYYVLVDYGQENIYDDAISGKKDWTLINKWSKPFKTVDLIRWTKSVTRELKLKEILE